MASTFGVIQEEFEEELAAIRLVIGAFPDRGGAGPRARVAVSNSTTLLVAATFEEFIREMARAYARAVVEASGSLIDLPKNFAASAWKRSIEALARVELDGREGVPPDALARFNVVYGFCRGDLRGDIYQDLIHNKNNMRPDELNSLFKVSGLSNVCALACNKAAVLTALGESDGDIACGRFRDWLNGFMEKRNQIAHAIKAVSSSSPVEILWDLALLGAFGVALAETLEVAAPPVPEALVAAESSY